MQGAGFISKKALQIIAVCDIISGYLRRSADMPRKYGLAGMMELADVPDSKSGGSDTVRVRPPPSAPKALRKMRGAFFCRFQFIFTVRRLSVTIEP